METERKVLPFLFVVTGVLNVLLIKWSDNFEGKCSDGDWRPFQHPIVQTGLMFLGQLLCFGIYKIVYFFLQRRGDSSELYNFFTRGGSDFSLHSLLLTAFLDALGSILLFMGLYLTYVSSFQMIRGAALIFSGIFGSIILSQPLRARHWMAIFTLGCGIVVILSIDVQRVLYDRASLISADANSVLTGNLLVLCSQVFHGAQFIYEEKLLKTTEMAALYATGWQGVFGLLITAIFGIAMNFIPASPPFGNNSRGVFDDLTDVFPQLLSNPWLLSALCIFVISCACYNYVALSIVKFSSAANRVMADSLRMLFIWWAALLLNWEYLNLITAMGFIILIMGAVAYRNAIFLEWYRSLVARVARGRYSDLSEEPQSDGPAAGGGVPTSRPADVI